MTSHIIDAYNLIFQCGLHPKSLGTGKAMRQAHDRLMKELSERFAESQRCKVVVVFDAKRKPNESDLVPNRGFDVRFAYEFADADAMIIDLVRTHSQPKQLTVVSSDHQIQTAATRRGAIAIDSDTWFDSSPPPHAPAESSEAAQPQQRLMSPAEQQEWVAEMQADLSNEASESESGPDVDSEPIDASETTFDNPFPDGFVDDLLD